MMTKDSQGARSSQQSPPSELGRRRFLRGAAVGAGAVGVAAMLPSILTRNAVKGTVGTADSANTAGVAHAPVLIYVRDALRGEAVIMRGDGESVVVDHALVAHLLRAEGRDQA